MRQEIDGREALGRGAMGRPRSRSLNLDDPGGSPAVPRPVHPAGPVESAKDALPARSLDGAYPAPPTGCTGPAADLNVGRNGRTTQFTQAARSIATETGHLHLLLTVSIETKDRLAGALGKEKAHIFLEPSPVETYIHQTVWLRNRQKEGLSEEGGHGIEVLH